MAGADEEVLWLVARADELGALEDRVGSMDVVVEESWPAGVDARIVALLRTGRADADAVAAAIGGEVERFDDEQAARAAASTIASSAGG